LRFEHDFGDGLTLRNTTRYGNTTNHYIVTNPDDGRGNVPNGFVLRNAKSRNSETTTTANLTDLIGSARTGRVEHRYAFGFETSREDMYNRNYSVSGLYASNVNSDFADSCSAPGAVGAASGYNCTTLANPNPNDPWTGTITPSSSPTEASTDTRSLYAFDTIALAERWLLNLGVRYDDYDARQVSLGSGDTLENRTDFWNHQAGVVFKPAAHGSVYFSTGTSSSPSGNTLGDGTENLAAGNQDLEPERDRTYELGTKWELVDRRLALTTAVFRTETTNARVSIEPGRGGAQQTIGDQRVDGFELGLVGSISDKWQMFGSLTYLDSVIVDDGPIGSDEGNDFPNTPRNSYSLWTTYQVLPTFTIGGGATFVDQRFGNTSNTVWIPSYTRYDAMASLAVGQRMKVQLNLHNLTDEVYFVRPYSNHYASLGPARSAVLSANIEF
jgi:catecholate siderophore receptor